MAELDAKGEDLTIVVRNGHVVYERNNKRTCALVRLISCGTLVVSLGNRKQGASHDTCLLLHHSQQSCPLMVMQPEIMAKLMLFAKRVTCPLVATQRSELMA